MEQKERDPKEREIIAEQVTNNIKEMNGLQQVEKMVKDNKIPFDYKGKSYRVRMPNWEEEEEANKFQNSKYRELLTTKDEKGNNVYLFKKEIKKLLKDQNIDLDKMDDEVKAKEDKAKNLMLRLAKLQNEQEINKLRNQIVKLREEQAKISITKGTYLENSIEDQLQYYLNSYLSYLVLEEKKGEGWKRVFNSFDEFKKSNDHALIQRAIFFLNYLIYNRNDEE